MMINVFFISMMVGAFLGIGMQFYFNGLGSIFDYYGPNESDDIHLFTNEKLSQYDGNTNEELYLSILGNVYDVTKGKKHYGPEGSYHAFVGRDASQSFITGDFNPNNLSDDVSKLSGDELLSLEKWKDFYDKEYVIKGKLIGRYYDSKGNPTEYLRNIEKSINEVKLKKALQSEMEIKFPPCNIEWTADTGTRVWCSENSGGIHRDWIGYPVKFLEPDSKSYRCACIKSLDEPDSFEYYDNCRYKTSCYINLD